MSDVIFVASEDVKVGDTINNIRASNPTYRWLDVVETSRKDDSYIELRTSPDLVIVKHPNEEISIRRD